MLAPRSLQLHRDDAVVRDEWKFVLSCTASEHILEVSRGNAYREYYIVPSSPASVVAKDGEPGSKDAIVQDERTSVSASVVARKNGDVVCEVVTTPSVRTVRIADPSVVIAATIRTPDNVQPALPPVAAQVA